MQDDYLEHTTGQGLLIRVNIRHGTFLLFRDGTPVSVTRGGIVNQIHPLTHIIFIGEAFDFTRVSVNTIGFYPVERSFMKIPFNYLGSSVIRYIRIPVLFDNVDALPAMVLYSRTYWPGPLPAVNEGMRYFIADPKIPRQSIVKLKTKYPRARVIIYNPDEMVAVRIEAQEFDKGVPKNKRAVDFVEREEAFLLAQNPVFAARVYLRKTEWRRMFSLPLFGRLLPEEVNTILTFLDTMIRNAEKVDELAKNIDALKDLADFYTGLSYVFHFEMPPVTRWRDEHENQKRQNLQHLILAVEAQSRFWQKEEPGKKAQFLEDALKILKKQEAYLEN